MKSTLKRLLILFPALLSAQVTQDSNPSPGHLLPPAGSPTCQMVCYCSSGPNPTPPPQGDNSKTAKPAAKKNRKRK